MNAPVAVAVRERVVDGAALARLLGAGLDPVLARLYAARGIRDPSALPGSLERLHAPDTMGGLARAAELLAQAILDGDTICVIGDYDCDGATATALTLRGLERFGARIDYLVPNRFKHGYGLSPPVVEAALAHPRMPRPRWLITVDNGIASVAGVAHARSQGMRVVITDHHLPGPTLPDADAIVDPNAGDCAFPSKHLAGVGVAFYLVIAVRARLRQLGAARCEASIADLLDLVALGTVADLVRLDDNNRRLVAAGLARIRAGRARPGIAALLQQAGVAAAQASVRDLGFALGPRINAAGRLDDITEGIECLLARCAEEAEPRARRLDAINRERRRIEADMREAAIADMPTPPADRRSIVLMRPDWHEGVVGLVAGRLKDRLHRPVVAFAPAAGEPGRLRGSGRSIAGIHMRDVLARVDACSPGLIDRFGGHAMAAGLSLAQQALPAFEAGLEAAVRELADPQAFQRELVVDGSLQPGELNLALVHLLDAQIWGQGFEPPLFCDRFEVARQRAVGNGHLQLELRLGGSKFAAIFFGRDAPLPPRATLAWRPCANTYRGHVSLQLQIEACIDAV